MGALEAKVLECLWGFEDAATPAEVLESIDSDLAYTTVMTILTRLFDKGLAERTKRGRAYAYRAALTEADLTARRMQAHLAVVGNRRAALTKFVETLPARDVRAVRALLAKME